LALKRRRRGRKEEAEAVVGGLFGRVGNKQIGRERGRERGGKGRGDEGEQPTESSTSFDRT
jgi:hypothetical protein